MDDQVEVIWREHRSELKGFLLKRVRSPAEAEDILHDVFLKMLANIKSVKRIDHMRAWLFAVARNAVADYFRSRRRTDVLDEEVFASQEPDEGLFKDIGPSLRLMLDALPEKVRVALILADLEGLRQGEVARRLGISLPAAKSRILRGRGRIRRMIEDCCQLEFDANGHLADYTVKAKNRHGCCQ